MILHEEQPFNAESGLAALAEPLTATNTFYVRGHGDVPDIDPPPGQEPASLDRRSRCRSGFAYREGLEGHRGRTARPGHPNPGAVRWRRRRHRGHPSPVTPR